MKELIGTQKANDTENSEIRRVIEKIMQATEGEEVGITVSALKAILSILVVHHSSYTLKLVIELLKANYKSCVNEAKKEAH